MSQRLSVNVASRRDMYITQLHHHKLAFYFLFPLKKLKNLFKWDLNCIVRTESRN